MQCIKHPSRTAVGICSVCGNGVCAECRTLTTLCPDCIEKQLRLPHPASIADTNISDPKKRLGKKRNLVAFILITVLYLLTLWSYFSPWHGGAFSISAVTAIVVSLILQLAQLWRDSVLARSSTTIAVLINLTLLIFYGSMFADSSSMIGVGCMLILVPIVLTIALYDVVSSGTLIGILLITWMLLAVLLGITSNIYWTSVFK